MWRRKTIHSYSYYTTHICIHSVCRAERQLTAAENCIFVVRQLQSDIFVDKPATKTLRWEETRPECGGRVQWRIIRGGHAAYVNFKKEVSYTSMFVF